MHGRDHVTRLKPEQRDHPLKFAGFHNQSPLLTMLQYSNNKKCPLCNVLFEVSILEDNKVTSNITADRMDNNKPHIKSNCKPTCVSCNVAKRYA